MPVCVKNIQTLWLCHGSRIKFAKIFTVIQKQPGSFLLLLAYIANHLLFLTEHPHKTTALKKKKS